MKDLDKFKIKQNTQQADSATLNDLNIFNFTYDKELPPSENIRNLYTNLDVLKLEFICESIHPDDYKAEEILIVEQATMKGVPSYVYLNLYGILNHLSKSINDYIDNDESSASKHVELLGARVAILGYLWHIHQINNDFIFLQDSPYTVHFTKKPGTSLDIAGMHLAPAPGALGEVKSHLSLREKFSYLLVEYIEFKIEDLKHKEANVKIEADKLQEERYNLLEIWLGLKEAGYLDHLENNDKKLSIHRKAFFELFGRLDTNYHNKHRNYYTLKDERGNFLRQLIELVKPPRTKKSP